MSLRTAIATGNWSSTSTWNGGVLPKAGDVIASNNFTVTIDQNINVDSLTNTAQSIVGLVPTMTSNTTPSGIATASFVAGLTFPAYYAFNGESSNNFFQNNLTIGDYVGYEFTSAKAVDQFFIYFGGNSTLSMTLQGWNGTTWVNIGTVSCSAVSFYTSPLLGNSTAYIKYQLVFNTAVYCQIREIQFYEYLGTTAAVAGGGFILNSGITCTLTNTTAGIIAGPTNCVTYSATSGLSIINGIVRGSTTVSNFAGVLHNNSGNLTIVGNIQNGTFYAAGNNPGVRKSGSGTLNIIGNLTSIVDSNGNSPLYNTGTGTINITGDLYGHTSNGYTTAFTNSEICTINITGNLYAGTAASANTSNALNNSVAATINITGNVASDKGNSALITTGASKLTIIGIISCTYQNPNITSVPGVSSTSSSAINLFSGPFLCSPYGFFPYQCVRMHLIPSTSNYIEFRDETTNGAVSPGAIAPATRMIAPAGVSDAPIPANVRYGTTYANGSLVGTLRMPNASSVAYGVAVDNTIGSAVLTPQSVWDYAIANLNTSGSIGERLKKVATVDSTGAQLSSFEF